MTWSIVTHDPATGTFAVAVATRAFAVGASCPFVRAGVGAVSTQSMTNRYLGPAILDGLARGLDPASAIEGALAGDSGSGLRQVHAVDRHGRTAAWTGRNCVEWCGSVAGASVAGAGVSVAGNMLAGEAVIAETLAGFQAAATTDGATLPLPERLMRAMLAGQAAGGDRRGRQSAAMRLITTELSQRPAGGRTAMGENGPAGGPRTSQGRHQGYFRSRIFRTSTCVSMTIPTRWRSSIGCWGCGASRPNHGWPRRRAGPNRPDSPISTPSKRAGMPVDSI